MNRDKTEQVFFEDAIGCTIDQAYQDMVATKKRFHKTDKVQGFHLVQSFAEGEVSPELAHLIGVELAERLLRGQFEVVITTHLNTSHFHNHRERVCQDDFCKFSKFKYLSAEKSPNISCLHIS